jgi:hypothetical protein
MLDTLMGALIQGVQQAASYWWGSRVDDPAKPLCEEATAMTGATEVTGRQTAGSKAVGNQTTGNGRGPLADGVSR